MDDEPAGGEPGRYVVVAVDGFGRRALFALDDDDLPYRGRVVAWLADLAAYLRDRRVVGRVKLVDRETGAVLVRRRVWP